MTEILTPQEQSDMREEIEYAREIHGDDFVWGKIPLTAKLADGMDRVVGGIQKLANSPTLQKINAGAQKMNARMQEADAQREREAKQNPRQQNRAPPGWNEGDTIMLGDAPRTRATQKKQKPQQTRDSLSGGIGMQFGDDHL